MVPTVAEEKLLRGRELMINTTHDARPFQPGVPWVHEIFWILRSGRPIRERVKFDRAQRDGIDALARDPVARKRIAYETAPVGIRTRCGGIVDRVRAPLPVHRLRKIPAALEH